MRAYDNAMLMLACHAGDSRCGCIPGAMWELMAAWRDRGVDEFGERMEQLPQVVVSCATEHPMAWNWEKYAEITLGPIVEGDDADG